MSTPAPIAQPEAGGLIPLESVNAVQLFRGGRENLDALLERIEQDAKSLVPDLKSATGRKEIASVAYKVARSKTTIDNAGKELVADLKREAGQIDELRRHARDFLDRVKAEVRAPLDEYEAEEKRLEEARRIAEEIAAAEIEAYQLNELWDRQREIERREAELARQEAERREREEAERRAREEKERQEREAAERKAREEQIAREAEERAKRKAEEARQREREAAERAAREAAEALEREKLARERAEREAKEAAERAEQQRIEAEYRAEHEKAEAEDRAKKQAEEAVERERLRAVREAEEHERLRRAEEEQKRQEAEARAADKANRTRVNAAIVEAFVSEGVGRTTAQKVVRLVASGSIPAMTIRY